MNSSLKTFTITQGSSQAIYKGCLSLALPVEIEIVFDKLAPVDATFRSA
jgi:hypothetical protein